MLKQNLSFKALLLKALLDSFMQTLFVLLLLWDVLRKGPSIIDVITMHHLSLPH